MTTVDEPQLALDAQVANGADTNFLPRQFLLHTHPRHKGDAHSHADKSLNKSNAGAEVLDRNLQQHLDTFFRLALQS